MASPKHAIPVSPILGANENLQADLVRAILSGYDATAAQGARIAVLAAKNANSSPDFDQDLTGLLTNARLAVHDGTNWGRLRGGIDNAVAAGNLRGMYVGGIVTEPADVFVDGDVSLLHFDLQGRLQVTSSDVQPGETIASPADIPVGVGATVPLPVIPAGTRRMTVQVTGGDGTSRIRVREVGGAAGRGRLLLMYGSTVYGGVDGALAALEVQNVAGPAATVAVQFEED